MESAVDKYYTKYAAIKADRKQDFVSGSRNNKKKDKAPSKLKVGAAGIERLTKK